MTFLACSGASILDDSTRDRDSRSRSLDVQLDDVEMIAQARGRPPDIVLMSIGGNDGLAFADLIARLLAGGVVGATRARRRLALVAQRLEYVGARLRRLGVGQTLVPTFFHFGRNERGTIDVNCEAMRGVSRDWTIVVFT